MILAAIITGYILGVLPFIVPKILERIDLKQSKAVDTTDSKEAKEIFDEWLNGPRNTETNTTRVNQEDIYEEYMTGIVKKGE